MSKSSPKNMKIGEGSMWPLKNKLFTHEINKKMGVEKLPFFLEKIVDQCPFLVDRELIIHGKMRSSFDPLSSGEVWKID